jgi:hypothetical protein
VGTLRGHKDKVSLAEQDPNLFDLPRPGEHRQVAYERLDAIADAGFVPDATISIEILQDIAVMSRYMDVFVIWLCCKDDRRRWEDGDKLDPISFMGRYRKER